MAATLALCLETLLMSTLANESLRHISETLQMKQFLSNYMSGYLGRS
jgi:hypothetical protein